MLNFSIMALLCLNKQLDTWQLDMYWIRIFSSLACFFMGIQMFYWMRISVRIAPYVELILEALNSVKRFLPVLGVLMFTFSMGFHLLQLNRLADNYSGNVEPLLPYDPEVNIFLDNFIVSSVKILLGDFGDINFRRH